MNTRLLRKVQKAILAEPAKFDMDFYFARSGESPCGTVACIAGHAIALTKKFRKLRCGLNPRVRFNAADIAQGALGLNYEGAWNLFHLDDWPSKYRRGYLNAKSARGKTRAAARRIDHFIATGGKE